MGGPKCIRTIGRMYLGTSSLFLCREVYYTPCLGEPTIGGSTVYCSHQESVCDHQESVSKVCSFVPSFAEKMNVKVVPPNAGGLPSQEEREEIKKAQEANKQFLGIPRKFVNFVFSLYAIHYVLSGSVY